MKKAVPVLVSSLLALVVLSLSGCFFSSGGGGPRFLYVGNTASPAAMSALTAASGSLTPITGSPFDTAGNSPLTLAGVSNRFLYAAVPSSNGTAAGGILLMPIHGDGSLGAAQLLASGGDYDGIAVTPNGKFLYAADVAGSRVVAFSIDPNTGALTGIGPQGPPPGVGVGPDPFNLTVDRQGKFLFVASCGCVTSSGQGIWVFSINADGTLTTVPESPFSLPAAGSTPQPSDLVVSPDGTLLFVSSYDDKVYVESINAVSGALSSAATPVSLPAGSAPGSVRTSTDGKFVYTADGGTGNLSMLTVGAGGALTDQGEVAVGGSPAVVLADPSGGFLYATNFDQNSVVVYSIGSDGRLTQTASVSTGGTGPFGLAWSH